MASSGPQEKVLSFKNASALQKANLILAHEIAYFSGEKAKLLETGGFIRKAGNGVITQPLFDTIWKDPATSSLPEIQGEVEVYEVTSVLSKAMLKDIKFSDNAKEVFDAFMKEKEPDKPLKLDKLVDGLIKVGALEEAKFIHNILHLGGKIVQAQLQKVQEKNILPEGFRDAEVMGAQNVAIIMSPWVSHIPTAENNNFSENNAKLIESIQSVFEKNENTFPKSFEETYKDPNYEAKLQTEYQKAFTEPEITQQPQPQKDTGNIFTRIIKAITDGIKNLFSNKSKETTEQKPKTPESNKKEVQTQAPLPPPVINEKHPPQVYANKTYTPKKDGSQVNPLYKDKADKTTAPRGDNTPPPKNSKPKSKG